MVKTSCIEIFGVQFCDSIDKIDITNYVLYGLVIVVWLFLSAVIMSNASHLGIMMLESPYLVL